ncbi:outer membrane protein assembly factor BamB [Malikia granosa]|uniref:Outer membrane protein assembly factor BamB n=1 Tax=Malikia granosa TaxID=263067 RepID=A0A2S9K1Z8_9BURK|nr:outer membrane protein assembly factor BamB [Malikia granosa]PRD64486.1 outer membrane protein assembly factor BamB [Malikia granosa]
MTFLSRATPRLAAAAAAVLLALAGCSSTPSKPKPAALQSFSASLPARQAWKVQLGEPAPQSVPVLVGRELALASADGRVLVLDADSGSERWRAELKAAVSAGVGYDGETAAVVTQDNELVALAQGKVQWRVRLPARAFSAPLVAGRRVFVLAGDRSVSAYDARNGAKLWTQAARGTEPLVLQQPGVLLAVGDTLVAGMGARLSGLNPGNGAPRWEVPVASTRGVNEIERLIDLVGPAARVQGQVCVRAFQAAVGCIDAQRGALRWTKPANGAVGLAADGERVYGTESNGRLLAWKLDGGELQWQSDLLLNRGLSAPLVAGRSIAIGDAQGFVHVLAREDGKLLNRLETDGSAIVSAPLLAGQNLLALTRKGVLYAWRPE